jgi:beta-lactamase class A
MAALIAPAFVQAPERTRRSLLAALGAAGLAGAGPGLVGAAVGTPDFAAAIGRIEADVGGRLGVAALRLGDGLRLAHRADERFAMCSTVKLLIVGAVLARVDRGQESLARAVAYSQADLLGYAPVSRAHLGEGALSVKALCEAAVTVSDNTAANLLLASLGGPVAITQFARGLGDGVTRLDRNEPTLNTAIPGDPRDTTSPRAMLADLRALALGEALSRASRALLVSWLVATRTGLARIRAGAPTDARIGDKTGTGDNGSTNDVAVIWPSHGGPILLSVYATGSSAPTPAIERAIAEAARTACGVLI